MNNQINVIDSQNQSITVNCICYFSNNTNNKKYLFYDKNEVVQDGLIKMYVSEVSNIVNDILPDEWNNLKLVMQDVIKGGSANVTNLPISEPIKLGGEKVIALTQNNIDSIRNNYNNDPKVMAARDVGSNKDLLAQSFGSFNTSLDVKSDTVQNVEENKMDLETAAVNMNINTDGVSNDTSNLTTSSIVNNEVSAQNDVGAINMFDSPIVTPVTEPKMESDFSVGTVGNIFDIPPVTVEPVVSTEQEIQQSNIFDVNVNSSVDSSQEEESLASETLFTSIPQVQSEGLHLEQSMEKENNNNNNQVDELDNDILRARIELEKSNYELFSKLAENSKKMAELLEKQMIAKNKEEDLEKTASDLFNSNGLLNESKVLGLKV